MKTSFIGALNARRPSPVSRFVPASASTSCFSIDGLRFIRIHAYPLETSRNPKTQIKFMKKSPIILTKIIRFMALAVLTGSIFIGCSTKADISTSMALLTNDSIVQLVKAGISEEIVLNMIKTQPAKFELGADEVLALKTGGVSEKIISAMILRGQGVGATSAASPSDSVKIQAKTPVRLIVDETLSSGISKSGQTFRLTVAENVTVDGKVVITKGALATGRITAVRKKSFPNSNGKLEFAVDSVQAIDGRKYHP